MWDSIAVGWEFNESGLLDLVGIVYVSNTRPSVNPMRTMLLASVCARSIGNRHDSKLETRNRNTNVAILSVWSPGRGNSKISSAVPLTKPPHRLLTHPHVHLSQVHSKSRCGKGKPLSSSRIDLHRNSRSINLIARATKALPGICSPLLCSCCRGRLY
jgi:hypothetical protein